MSPCRAQPFSSHPLEMGHLGYVRNPRGGKALPKHDTWDCHAIYIIYIYADQARGGARGRQSVRAVPDRSCLAIDVHVRRIGRADGPGRGVVSRRTWTSEAVRYDWTRTWHPNPQSHLQNEGMTGARDICRLWPPSAGALILSVSSFVGAGVRWSVNESHREILHPRCGPRTFKVTELEIE